jgi:hypothetical protein
MKAVVVEIRDKFAAVLSDDGRIVKITNKNYEIGQVIEMKTQTIPKTRKLAVWAASFIAVVTLCGASAWAYFTPYSYVSLDVNPSVEYSLNRFDIVLDAEAVNDDGEEILNEIKVENLKNQPIKQAISETIEQISENGYFDDDTEGGIVIATSCNNNEKAEELAEELQLKAEEQIQENGNNVVVEVISVGYERVLNARELGVTPGKLNLVEKLKASSSDPDSIDIEEWLNKPVKEIMKATKENRKSNETAIDDEDKANSVPNNNKTNVNSKSNSNGQQEKVQEKNVGKEDKIQERAAVQNENAQGNSLGNEEKVQEKAQTQQQQSQPNTKENSVNENGSSRNNKGKYN